VEEPPRTPPPTPPLLLTMFTIQKFTGPRGSCRFLWRLTLLSSLWPCMSTIVPGIISPLKGTVSPRFWAASPFSLLGRIPCLALLRLRKSSINHFFFSFVYLFFFCLLMLGLFRFVGCWNLLRFMNWVWGFCDLLVLLSLGLVLLPWISNCCLCGQVWSYRSQILFLIKEIQIS